AAFPTTVVLVALAWGVLSRAGRAVGGVVRGGMVAEFLLMFWWHWWLLFHAPGVLEPGGDEEGPRTHAAHLLNECLGNAAVVFFVCAVLVQLALIVLLFTWRAPRERET